MFFSFVFCATFEKDFVKANMSKFDVIRYDSGVFTVDFDRNGSFNLILPFLTLNTYFSAGCPAYPK